ncbi:hypothetical protein T02_6239 [Trichinella nativa]|uniref:Uncharacterized protein n=4 Tax=Trichinella TaxID=6333 RepID=A0A0V1LSW1_9BILA|nr:hypothetical protein T05_7956 [Trichinella murrelli]KRX75338.1 hypothetical protein T06_2835 [Trichinella sp. T6]KRY18830.1 hypothetical protein T12_250 [Trichinella patagoniensis]KRY60226.1 hypothetical protein T03_15775 [Trichinella britovi]KRZ62597.1 hypothetical protein T02_6239 [Trichinella nativa]
MASHLSGRFSACVAIVKHCRVILAGGHLGINATPPSAITNCPKKMVDCWQRVCEPSTSTNHCLHAQMDAGHHRPHIP